MRRLLEQLPYSTSSYIKMHIKVECKQQDNANIVDI